MKMKTGDKTLAVLLLSAFLASGCATISPPIVEQEEELTGMERATQEEKKAEEELELRRWQGNGD
jgi:starvation-inducible outer membrane lipoprotein